MTHIIDTAIWYAGVLFIGLGSMLGVAIIAMLIVALLMHLCDHIATRGKFLKAFVDWYWRREMLAAVRRDIANGGETQESVRTNESEASRE